jgi:hypothetical protein
LRGNRPDGAHKHQHRNHGDSTRIRRHASLSVARETARSFESACGNHDGNALSKRTNDSRDFVPMRLPFGGRRKWDIDLRGYASSSCVEVSGSPAAHRSIIDIRYSFALSVTYRKFATARIRFRGVSNVETAQ